VHRKWTIGMMTLAAALAAGAAQAVPSRDAGWYAGLDLARSRLGLNGSDLDRGFAAQGITGATSLDRGDTTWGLTLGYRINPHFALEGGYTDLGKFGYGTAVTAPAADRLSGDYKAHAWWLAPVGIVPLSDRAALYGKLGVTDNHASFNPASGTGATAPAGASHSNAGWLVGAGATYDFTPSLYGKLGWDRYARVDAGASTGREHADVFSVGLGLHF
jgi:OOP family OmpA-OmpF porin